MAILALCIIIGIIVVIYALLRFSVRISYSFESTAKNKASVIVKYFFFTLYENPESEKRKKAKAKKLAKKEKKVTKKKTSKKPVKKKEPPKKDIIDEINDFSEEETEQKIIELEKEISEQKELYNESVKKASIKERKKTNKTPKPKKSKKPKKQGKLSQIKEKWNMIKPYAPLTWKTLRRLLKKIRFYNTEIDIMLGNEDPYKAAVNYGYANMAFYQSLAFLCMIFSIKIKSCDLNTEFTEKKLEVKLSGNVYIRVSTILGILLCYGAKMLKIYLSERSKNSTDKKQDKELLKNEQ
ncbi:MAG: hypothetical protein LUH57_05050 [Ruminococcus sp.]|nr:hypothetical protein [Ruminococcus sp.]